MSMLTSEAVAEQSRSKNQLTKNLIDLFKCCVKVLTQIWEYPTVKKRKEDD